MQESNKITRHIPNLITCLNIFAGSLAVILSFEGKSGLITASYLIFLAVVLDFLDGFFARILNARTKIGKQLDSLADMISFGIAPTVIIYQMMKFALRVNEFSFDLPTGQILLLLSPLTIVIFSGIRLAKFNIDDSQTNSFLGLATTANGLLIASLPIISDFNPDSLLLPLSSNIYFFLALIFIETLIVKVYFLLPLIFITSFLLISGVPMFSLKISKDDLLENKLKLTFLILSVVLIITLQVLAIPIIIFFYLIFSLINNIIEKKEIKKTEKI